MSAPVGQGPWDADFVYVRCGALGYTASPPPHVRACCTAQRGHSGPHHDGTWARWEDDDPRVVAANERERRVREAREQKAADERAKAERLSRLVEAVAVADGAAPGMSTADALTVLADEVKRSSLLWAFRDRRAAGSSSPEGTQS